MRAVALLAACFALACSGLNFSTAVYSAATFEQAKSVSPSGQLPLLTWGDTLLTESRDIIRHIASHTPQVGLSSESAPLTDEFLTELGVLVEWLVAEDEHTRAAFARHFNDGEPSQQFEDLVLAHSRSNAERHGISDWPPSERMSRLLELLQELGTHTSATPWLGGERPNMADCIAGASLRTLINVGKLEQNTSHIAAVLYREPRVMDWLQRLDAVVESAA